VLITDRATGLSRGFGFITYDDVNDARDAVKEMNSALVEDRRVRRLVGVVCHGVSWRGCLCGVHGVRLCACVCACLCACDCVRAPSATVLYACTTLDMLSACSMATQRTSEPAVR
jgi:hypothetical protein